MTIQPLGPDDPERIGRYRLLGALEPTAGFRSVLAVAPDNALVVVHQVQPDLLAEPDLRIRLRHSAIAGMRVSGASNTTVLDVDADEEKPWLASAFVPGTRLDRAVAAHGPLPVPAVRALAAALATALRTVHGAGLVHQRVRADTVLLTKDSGRLGAIGITAPASPPRSGTATVLGTPEFLSPEQTLGLELTPAADVFALGSVLAFAAGGLAPFTAPSVPYLLFNIAQREPDLSRVPEPLREMIAACLRKEPGARPTPAQILDYLGGPSSAPAPWPPAVVADIDSLEQQVSSLLAALPPAIPAEPAPERPLPEVVAAAAATARAAVVRRWRATEPPARRALAACLAVLLVIAATSVVLLVRESGEAAPVTGLTLAELRQIDACVWLDTAIGDAVPVPPTPLPKDAWKLTPTPSWGCQAVSGKNSIDLTLGKEMEYLTEHRTFVDDVPIIHGTPHSCARVIASPGKEHDAGLVIDVNQSTDEKNCGAADYLIGELARSLTTAPRARDRAKSLVTLDPCELLVREELARKIGPLPKEPTVADAHTCEWTGRVDLTVDLLRTSTLVTGGKAITVDGVQIFVDQGRSPATCTRAARAPGSDEETIEVEIAGIGADRRDEYCAVAVAVLREVVGRLPAR
ncbi:protein kinase domain-containing protein [Nocardia sp. A7]|uniref:protein kinase domain-containing protein n=1 Tax=Nocardia sp. A7 TaxID=2789274 RepID=UPI00397B079A